MTVGTALVEGLTVTHPKLGPGRIVKVDGPYVWVFFSQVGADGGEPTKQLVLDRCMLAPAPELADDPSLTPPPPRRAQGNRAGRKPARPRVSVEHMVQGFLSQYPGGFSDAGLIERELRPRRTAAELFGTLFGGTLGRTRLADGDHAGIADGLQKIYQATSLLSRFELIAMNDGLKDPAAAAGLLEAVLDVVATSEQATFDRLVEAVERLPKRPKGKGALNWPAVTLLPSFAEPSRFLMLKPKATRATADAYGFDLRYETRPNWTTFARAQEFGAELLEKLRAHGASDLIDVQSFISVVASSPAIRQPEAGEAAAAE